MKENRGDGSRGRNKERDREVLKERCYEGDNTREEKRKLEALREASEKTESPNPIGDKKN